MSERSYFNSSLNALKSPMKRVQSNTIQTQPNSYDMILSSVYTKSPNKTKPSMFTSDKMYIHQLQQQVIQLKDQVKILTKENMSLKAHQDTPLHKLKHQYTQMVKYSKVLGLVKTLKLENRAMKEDMLQFQRELQIHFAPLKQITNHIVNEPRQLILDVMKLSQTYLANDNSMLKHKAELLSIERGDLLDRNLQQYDMIQTLLSAQLVHTREQSSKSTG